MTMLSERVFEFAKESTAWLSRSLSPFKFMTPPEFARVDEYTKILATPKEKRLAGLSSEFWVKTREEPFATVTLLLRRLDRFESEALELSRSFTTPT